jgi:hypothetical protein
MVVTVVDSKQEETLIQDLVFVTVALIIALTIAVPLVV